MDDDHRGPWIVWREWTTDETEVRTKNGKRVQVVVERSWANQEKFEDMNAALVFYRNALRGDWVPAAAKWWEVSSPDPKLEEIFHGRPVPMPAYIREKLAALNLRVEGMG